MSKDLSLFTEKDFTEKTMSVKDVSDIMGVTPEAIKKWVRELFPDKIKNGQRTLLSEAEVTAIKLKMRPTTKVVGAKTDLEKALIIQQAAMFQQEMIDRLTIENKQLLIENKEMTPKAEFYDRVTESDKTFDMSSVCKILDIKDFGRTKLMAYLRDKKILRKNNEPYQDYLGYFKSVETETAIGIKLKPVAYQKGIDYLIKRLKKDNILTY